MGKRKQQQACDVNALAFDPDDSRDPRSKHFIPRSGARKRGVEITFDPSQHKCVYSTLPLPVPCLHSPYQG